MTPGLRTPLRRFMASSAVVPGDRCRGYHPARPPARPGEISTGVLFARGGGAGADDDLVPVRVQHARDALAPGLVGRLLGHGHTRRAEALDRRGGIVGVRSEEHTSGLQSRQYLVWRLLLAKNNSA